MFREQVFSLLLILGALLPPLVIGEGIVYTEGVNKWGEWGPWQHCPPNYFVNAIMVKQEDRSWSRSDETGTNGIMLYCSELDYSMKADPMRMKRPPIPLAQWNEDMEKNPKLYISSTTADWGQWSDAKTCPSGIAIGMMTKNQPNQGESHDGMLISDECNTTCR